MWPPVRLGGAAFTYTLSGVDVKRMPRPDAMGLALERGRYLNEADTNGAVVGKAAAAALDVAPGDELALKDELGHAARFRIVGVFAGDVAIANSICFSPDGRTMYYADSATREIRCCDYGTDADPDAIANPRVFVPAGAAPGDPDGSAEQVINCRCVAIAVQAPDDEEGE